MEKGTIQDIEKDYFGEGYISGFKDEDISREGSSLTTYSFAGLFTITGFLALLALVCSECSSTISRYLDPDGADISEVNSVDEATGVISPEGGQQDSMVQVEITGQEVESDEQQVLQESTTLNIHPADDGWSSSSTQEQI